MDTAVQGFAAIEDRLEEVRVSLGLPPRSDGASAAPVEPSRRARRRVVTISRRVRVGDLVLLGAAWTGLLGLVVLAI